MKLNSGALRLSLLGLGREWHSGELRLLMAALVVAVASMTAVGFFTDRVERAMFEQASELLAADVVMHSSAPIDSRFTKRAQDMGLAVADTLSFRSVLLVGEQLELAEVKAVSANYPLRGTLRIAEHAYGPDNSTSATPSLGNVWIDARLASKLHLNIGDFVELGESRLQIESVLSYEPDRGGDMFAIAPRLMMNYRDVDATGLVQPGSRVTYAMLLAGASHAVQTFQDISKDELGDGEHFHAVRDGRPELRSAIERAEQFLGLAALVAVLLSGAAIAVSSRRYVERRLNVAAIMRCMGASQKLITTVFCIQILSLGLAASLVGCALGFAAQSVLVHVFSSLLVGDLPIPSLEPVFLGLVTGVVTLAGFALPPLMRLRDVSPARVIRRDLGGLPPRAVTAYGFAFIALGALVFWQANDAKLASYVLGSAIVTLLVLSLFAVVLVRSMRRLRTQVGVSWRFGLANLSRRANGSVLQIVAFGLGFTMLLLLSIVRGDILDEWQRNLPVDAPNYFLINVQPTDVAGLQSFLTERGLESAALYPMIRGRLSAINQQPIASEDYESARAQRLAIRQFNLSWAEQLKPGNTITAGRWWQSNELDDDLFSVEQGIADTLGISTGDTLTFDVAGKKVTGTVSNLRAVEWDSFDVNFFVVSPPALLQEFPSTFISSFHLPVGDHHTLIELVREFPSVTVLDVDALVTKVRQIMEQAVLGVEYVFMFTILAGVVVLLAAVQSTMDERRFETAIIRALGGKRAMIWRGLLSEFVTLGLLAGVLAAFISTIVGSVVAKQIFSLSYQGDPKIWLIGLLAGGIGTGVAGLLGAGSALRQSPLATLRQL